MILDLSVSAPKVDISSLLYLIVSFYFDSCICHLQHLVPVALIPFGAVQLSLIVSSVFLCITLAIIVILENTQAFLLVVVLVRDGLRTPVATLQYKKQASVGFEFCSCNWFTVTYMTKFSLKTFAS